MVVKTSILDKNSGGFLKRKLGVGWGVGGVGANEKAILKGENYDPVGYEWMFKVLWGKFREPDEVPIVRTVGN